MYMKKSPYRTTVIAILIFLLTTVCNLPTDRSISPTQIADATPTPSDYLIPETTKVLDSNLQESLESISPEGILIFSRTSPALESLEAGDILVSDSVQVAPDGFLRKVRTVRVEGEKVIIETDDAELIEAVHEGHVGFVQDLRAEDIRSTWLYPGITFHGTSQVNQN